MKNLTLLTEEELYNIEGGSFWKDAAYAVGRGARFIYDAATAGDTAQVMQRW